MRLKYFFLLSTIFVLFSCRDDSSIGSTIQPQQDKVKVGVDTFRVNTYDSLFHAISAQCSDSLSMLLGNYHNSIYGSTKADLIVQMAPPINYVFPNPSSNPKPDSLVLYLFFNSWYGSSTEPLEIAIYELNKQTPDYNTQYFTNLDPSTFLDIEEQQLLGKKIATSVDHSLSKEQAEMTNTRYLKYKFSDAQVQRFFDIPQNSYQSTEAFFKEFKGLYITTTFGNSTMLYLLGINMNLHYHYSYKTTSGKDTTVNTSIIYPANKEVRQLNIITHNNIESLINKNDSANLITTAGGSYPVVEIPFDKIKNRIVANTLDKQRFVNSAILTTEVVTLSSEYKMSSPPSVLLISAKDCEDFIKTNSIAALNKREATLSIYDAKSQSYSFDIAYLIDSKTKATDGVGNNKYVMIPVDVYTNSSGVVVNLRPRKRIGAAGVRSGKNSNSPMRIEIVYSGF